MAQAIACAVINAKLFKPEQLLAYDPAAERQQLFTEQLQIPMARDNAELAQRARTIILAVKPQQVPDVLDQLSAQLSPDHLVISIAAGISTSFIQQRLNKPIPVIRTMPNTPLMVNAGVTALCKGTEATDEHLAQASEIFAAAGQVVLLEEKLIDAVTAISGSGPAYFFYLAEAMIQAGLDLGIDKPTAAKLAAMTCFGAGKMMLQSSDPPEQLRAKVTSPGGTTAAAIDTLEALGAKQAWISAINAAQRRSRQLGK